jgi:DNA-directed RNA polymerase subunit RPC12/RpoP
MSESGDAPQVRVKERIVLKKFDARPDGREWTNEEIDAGEADEYLVEVLVLENQDGEEQIVMAKPARAEPEQGYSDPAAPTKYSIACTGCGMQLSFDVVPSNRVIACPNCNSQSQVLPGMGDES